METVSGCSNVSIIDIRRDGLEYSLLDEIREKLDPASGQERRMPTLLLYDERGLKLFEDITYLDEYYLTNSEIEVLENHADEIARHVQARSMVVELGSGNLRKVKILLEAFEKAAKPIDYYALDLSRPELERTLSAVRGIYQHVRCFGLLGTYDDGLDWLKCPENEDRPKSVLWMGSSIGNLNRSDAAGFLKNYSTILQPRDTIILGVDACQDPDKVFHAYNDREGKTHEFVLNGLVHANRLMGKNAFNPDDWEIIGEYDAQAGRHQAFYSPTNDVVVEGVLITAGERIRVEESYKYSPSQTDQLWQAVGLLPQAKFGNYDGDYHVHILSTLPFSGSKDPDYYATNPVPSLYEFKQMWAAWDLVTRRMIPREEMLSKPIKLRNACIFYLGHIPAFFDMHLTRATGTPATEPAFYHQLFERGIDPDVDNPENCHAHSEIPDEWPPLKEILEYQERVRARTKLLYRETDFRSDRKVGRAIWLGFEHEAMHLETLLYMLVQSDKTVPPAGLTPNFAALAKQAQEHAVPNQWIKVPQTNIKIGMNDLENDQGPDRYFGWDNEKPQRMCEVPSFETKARPLTNEDYGRFLEHRNEHKIPASWTLVSNRSSAEVNGNTQANGYSGNLDGFSAPLTDAFLHGKFVRTVYGAVPLRYALHWPVFASYDELNSCAKWMNGRIPTAEEVHSIYAHAEAVKSKEVDSILTRKISAVNGHLSNEGVEISPPSHHSENGADGAEKVLNPHDLFVDLEGCNVGFKHFHPTPVTQNGNKLYGQGNMGGVWEWTSSVLEKHDGFMAGELYPAYTEDFFDGKHNIVLGGSWATHARIAGRKTFINWYQRNYPYAWCGARIVRDIQ